MYSLSKNDKFADMDVMAMLDQLSVEELEELDAEFDPDIDLPIFVAPASVFAAVPITVPEDERLPPSERCKYEISAPATGPFNRRHLIEHIEAQARAEKDWDTIPYEKKEPAHRWQAPEKDQSFVISDFSANRTGDAGPCTNEEFDEILAQATEEDLVDLAAVLGFHGILTQDQYQAALKDQPQKFGGFDAPAKATPMRIFADPEAVNTTDVNKSVRQLRDDDPALKTLNLNNIKGIELDIFESLFNALESNNNLSSLSLASTGLTDRSASHLASALRINTTLRRLNVESNFMSSAATVALLAAVNENQTLTHLAVSNQRQKLGARAEQELADLMQKNDTLQNLGATLESAGPRNRIQTRLERNVDQCRIKRRN